MAIAAGQASAADMQFAGYPNRQGLTIGIENIKLGVAKRAPNGHRAATVTGGQVGGGHLLQR